MKTMKFLLLREWWESRQLFIRTGLILIALSVVSAIISAIVMQDPDASRILPGAVLTAEQLSKEVDGIAGHSLAGRMFGFCVAMIFFMYSYFSGALSEERKDRSILFWKSLPVSDAQTVMAKVLFGVLAIPLFMLVASIISNILALSILCIGHALQGRWLFLSVFSHAGLWSPVLDTLRVFPVFILWSLPTVGWLLLVSSVLTKRVGLWAVLGPVAVFFLLVLLCKSLNMTLDSFVYLWLGRLLFSLLPFSWLLNAELLKQHNGFKNVLDSIVRSAPTDSWDTFLHLNIWCGVLVGALFIYGAIRMRTYRE